MAFLYFYAYINIFPSQSCNESLTKLQNQINIYMFTVNIQRSDGFPKFTNNKELCFDFLFQFEFVSFVHCNCLVMIVS